MKKYVVYVSKNKSDWDVDRFVTFAENKRDAESKILDRHREYIRAYAYDYKYYFER